MGVSPDPISQKVRIQPEFVDPSYLRRFRPDLGDGPAKKAEVFGELGYILYGLPVVPHKAVAEVSE